MSHVQSRRGGEEIDVQHLYRAMDFLHAAMPELQEHLYFQVSDLLNADVSVLFYDTTSVSFYLDEADPAGGLRRYGHSKKKRPDLPQIVVALAINRDGIPIRHWIFPGNRSDVTTVEEVTRDLLGLHPRRFLIVGDRGMVSQANLDATERTRGDYRFSHPPEPAHALQEPAVYVVVQGRKQVTLGDAVYVYDRSQYLAVSVELPVVTNVLEASPAEPYLCLTLTVDPRELAALIVETGRQAPRDDHDGRALYVSPLRTPLLDGLLRLVRLLDAQTKSPCWRL